MIPTSTTTLSDRYHQKEYETRLKKFREEWDTLQRAANDIVRLSGDNKTDFSLYLVLPLQHIVTMNIKCKIISNLTKYITNSRDRTLLDKKLLYTRMENVAKPLKKKMTDTFPKHDKDQMLTFLTDAKKKNNNISCKYKKPKDTGDLHEIIQSGINQLNRAHDITKLI